MMRNTIAAALLCWAANAAAGDIAGQLVEPRNYGYVLGDLIERRVEFQLPDQARLQADSLPRPGRANRFLELRDIREESSANGQRGLVLRYQVIGVADQIHPAELPAGTVQFAAGSQTYRLAFPSFAVGVGPVSQPNPGDALLGDVPPQTVDTQPAIRQTLSGAILAMLLAFPWLAWRYLLPHLAPGRRPFAQAYRELRRLPRQADPAVLLNPLHRGFNLTHGATVLPGSLEEFFARRPAYRGAEAEIRSFFAASHGFLFGGRPLPEADVATQDLLALGRRLRDIERRL